MLLIAAYLPEAQEKLAGSHALLLTALSVEATASL